MQTKTNGFNDALNLDLKVFPAKTPLFCPAENCYESRSVIQSNCCNAEDLTIKLHDYVKDSIANYAEQGLNPRTIEIEKNLGGLNADEFQIIEGCVAYNVKANVQITDLWSRIKIST